MRSTLTRGTVVACLAILAAAPALAGGFQVQQQGAKASGRGGAFAAQADDASATFFNPAAAGHLDGWNFYLGGGLQMADVTFDAAAGDTVDMQDSPVYPTQIYFTGPIGDHYAFAFGTFNPYALRTHWLAGDPVETSALKSVWNTVEFNLSIIAKISEKLSVAIGYEHVRMVIEDFSQVYDTTPLAPFLVPGQPSTDPQQNITLAGNKAGVNLAVHYVGDNGYRFGMSFRSQKIIRADGWLKWSDVEEGPFFLPSVNLADESGCLPDPNMPGSTYCPLGAAFTDSKAGGTFVLPATVDVGFGRAGQGKWDWEADLLWSKWVKFDSIDIIVDSPNGIQSGLSTKLTTASLTRKENWKSTLSVLAGADYHFNDHHTARFGITYDPSAVPEKQARPYLADGDKIGLTGGYGWNGMDGQVTADLYAQYWIYGDRTTPGGPPDVVPGSYSTSAFAIGGSVQFHF
jgi:long-chain fatty acid transport protein